VNLKAAIRYIFCETNDRKGVHNLVPLAKPIKKRRIKGDGTWGYAFIAVALVVFALFTAYPVASAFMISFQNYKPLGSTFVGLDNYAATLKDTLFWKSMVNTIVYTFLTVPVALSISFALAILILPLKKKLQSAFKAIICRQSLPALPCPSYGSGCLIPCHPVFSICSLASLG
jgi:ABC-type polysaccharide transport system permease subunit